MKEMLLFLGFAAVILLIGVWKDRRSARRDARRRNQAHKL